MFRPAPIGWQGLLDSLEVAVVDPMSQATGQMNVVFVLPAGFHPTEPTVRLVGYECQLFWRNDAAADFYATGFHPRRVARVLGFCLSYFASRAIHSAGLSAPASCGRVLEVRAIPQSCLLFFTSQFPFDVQCTRSCPPFLATSWPAAFQINAQATTRPRSCLSQHPVLRQGTPFPCVWQPGCPASRQSLKTSPNVCRARISTARSFPTHGACISSTPSRAHALTISSIPRTLKIHLSQISLGPWPCRLRKTEPAWAPAL